MRFPFLPRPRAGSLVPTLTSVLLLSGLLLVPLPVSVPAAGQTSHAQDTAPAQPGAFQSSSAESDAAAGGSQPAQTTFDPALFGALQWRNVGPDRGGRSIAVAGTPSRVHEYYFGATGGGLWKTSDGGITWRPMGDGQFQSSTVGALAQCYADPDVVYAGMGEVQLRGDIIPGDGVYRSTDAGVTWTHVGLAAGTGQQMVGRVRVHPDDCRRVWVAVLGDVYGTNPERGVYRSSDGGDTWERVLYRDDKTGAVDLVMDPSNPDVLYASLWEVFRRPWMLSSGGPGSGLFKSTDGGSTWTELTRNPGLPQGMVGKIGVSVSGADPDRVYAIIEAEDGGVFVSDDGGATWTRVSEDRNLRQRAFYYTRLYADPMERETVYVVNVQFWRSRDGGSTWESIAVPHGDNHDLWIADDDNQRMINSNDGGANVSVNGGASWTGQRYPTAQMYDVSLTSHFPYHICGGQQDNSASCVPSDGDGSYWYDVAGCETGPVTPHPEDTDIYYGACYGGSLQVGDRSTGQSRAINVWPVNPMGNSAGDIRERFQWNLPIRISPHDPEKVYVASQYVWESTNRGQSWRRISPDLTYADPSTLGPSGGPITRDQTSVEYYATVWEIAPSPHDPGTLWVGSDDGRVHITRDGGGHWEDITPPDLPRFSRVFKIDVSPHRPGKAYLAAVRYRMQDVAPYAYKTEDYGQTWTKIVEGVPEGHFIRVIREDLRWPGLLYAGTEHGVLVSFDDGGRWHSLQLNLPDVSVQGMALRDDDVVIATHGRSFYVLDNVEPLRQYGPSVAGAQLHLFQPAVATRTLSRPTDSYGRRKSFAPQVDYWLGADADTVRIEILDRAGDLIRSYDVTGARAGAGLHRFSWDMRYPSAADFPGMIFWAANTAGPLAPPGSYQVRVTAHGQTQVQPLEIRKDPRLEHVSDADFQAQFRLASRIRDRTDDANRAVIAIRELKSAIDDRVGQAEDDALAARARAFKEELSAVEEEIYQVRMEARQDPLNYPIMLNNQIAALRGIVESADARPTDQAVEAFLELSGLLEVELRRLAETVEARLPELNGVLRQLGVAEIPAPELPGPEDG